MTSPYTNGNDVPARRAFSPEKGLCAHRLLTQAALSQMQLRSLADVGYPSESGSTTRRSEDEPAHQQPCRAASLPPGTAAQQQPKRSCFVCEADGVDLVRVCRCTDRWLHLRCQQQLMQRTTTHQFGCPVCLTTYTNVESSATRIKLTRDGWRLVAYAIGVVGVAAIGACEYHRSHLEPTTRCEHRCARALTCTCAKSCSCSPSCPCRFVHRRDRDVQLAGPDGVLDRRRSLRLRRCRILHVWVLCFPASRIAHREK